MSVLGLLPGHVPYVRKSTVFFSVELKEMIGGFSQNDAGPTQMITGRRRNDDDDDDDDDDTFHRHICLLFKHLKAV